MPLSLYRLPLLLLLPTCPVPNHLPGNIYGYMKCRLRFLNECEEPCLADSSATSFPLIPLCWGTHIIWILLCCISFNGKWWQSENNLEFIQKLWRASWLLECQKKKNRCSYLCSPFLYSPLYKPCWHVLYSGILWCGAQEWCCAPILSPICTPKHQCLLLVLDLLVYQTRPLSLSGLNLFCH